MGTRWRRLPVGRQALLVLAHLRCGHTYAQLAAGFGVGTTTVYRYVVEAVQVLAAGAPDLTAAARAAARKAFVILDGTLLPIDRIAADRPYYSGKHHQHGMNIQVIADPLGRLLWASPALPRAVHDIRAARTHGIIDTLTSEDVPCWADKAYQGAGGTVRVPYRGRWETLSTGQQAHNRSHARIRALGEQAVATLKSWRLLRKLRCAAPPASPTSSKPSSPSTWQAQTEVGNGSLTPCRSSNLDPPAEAGRVLKVEDWAEIRRLHGAEGVSIEEIARRLGVARNTVRAALSSDRPPKYQRAPRGQVADGFEPRMRALLNEWPRMPAPVIAERIGWPYSMAPLRKRLALVRPE